MQIYFPSCNFNIASPQTARKARAFLKERMAVAGCCRFDKKEYQEDDVGIIVCQACRETLQEKIKTITLWEYLDQDPSFVWPNYQEKSMGLQDCWRDRDHPEVHQAVRNILKKMNIHVVEIENNKEKSTFCGTLHFESHDEKNKQLLSSYPDTKISQLPEEVQKELMKEQVDQFDCEWIICDCNRCLKGITLGGGKGVHLLDLIMGDHEIIQTIL